MRGLPVRVTGVDVRPRARSRNAALAESLGADDLRFVEATIGTVQIDDRPDIVLALHACDTATDDALARALGWEAPVVLAAPCCHHHLQAQLRRVPTPEPYSMLTRHGILRERLADTLTDALRACLLRLHGYRVDVVEFVASAHTPRNTLLRAVRTGSPAPAAVAHEYDQLVGAWQVRPRLAELVGVPPNPRLDPPIVSRRWPTGVLLVAMAVAGVGGSQSWGQDDGSAIVVRDPRLTESSGLAVSPDDPGLLLTVNDSGHEPVVYVVDRAAGSVVGTTTLVGIDPDDADTEAVAVDGDGRVWVADTGDNLRNRDDVSLYALAPPGSQPGAQEATTTPTRYPLRYPGGPADAETLLADPSTGQLWVVTKGLFGGSVLAVPDTLVAGEENPVEALDLAVPALVTDGTVLPDGTAAVLRTYQRAYVYALPDWRLVGDFALPPQQQGESLTALPDGTTLLAGSEGSPARIARVELPPDVLRELRAGDPGGSDGSGGCGRLSGLSGLRARDVARRRRRQRGRRWARRGANRGGGAGGGAVAVLVIALVALVVVRVARRRRT